MAAVIKGKDYKEYGNERCLFALIWEIKKLEENGIEIQTSEGNKTVYFLLGLVLGDNLGLNTVLGFVSSFSANFFFRFCKVKKNESHSLCVENRLLLRNELNHDEDVIASNLSLTGIRENSILNLINSFHVTKNFAIDIMHDIFEGVCHYNICHIIMKLILI